MLRRRAAPEPNRKTGRARKRECGRGSTGGGAHEMSPPDAEPRKLVCCAFLNQLPVGWKCSRCLWKYSIPLTHTRPRFQSSPPLAVVTAFSLHVCEQHSPAPDPGLRAA